MEVEKNKVSGTQVGEGMGMKEALLKRNILEIELVAGYFGTMDISNAAKEREAISKDIIIKKKKRTGRKNGRKVDLKQVKLMNLDSGKRQLVEVMTTEGTPEE